MIFYLVFTRISEFGIAKLTRKLSHGQATAGGEALRKAAA
jgi:polar amino acid transport system permease protein